MATTIAKYIDGCQDIVDAKPAYKNGASDLNECDCIGMDKYSFRKNKVSFSTTGTNYSFRNQVENIREISSASDLKVGDVVFKAYAPGDKGWNLPAKYQQGGSGYNGDLNDYYHIGTVKSVSPLQIIHMTSPTAKTDTKVGTWKYAANWKSQYISDSPDPGPEPEPPTPEPQTAMVVADKGSTVNMRKKPDINSPLVERVPIGTIVDILDYGADWCKIAYTDSAKARWVGYMMTQFLDFDYNPTTETYTVHIPFLPLPQAKALLKQYPGAWMTKDEAVG